VPTWAEYEDMHYMVEFDKEEKECPVGCIGLWLKEPYSIWSVAVRKDSERQGIGTRLVQAALKWYGKHMPHQQVWAFYEEPSLRTFYEKQGFVSKKIRKSEAVAGAKTMVWQVVRRSLQLALK
jgi:GNAT superfamily N-acetyltransferase